MLHPLLALDDAGSVPSRLVTEKGLEAGSAGLSETGHAFAAAQGFEAKPGAHCLLPGPGGALETVLFGIDEPGANGADPFLVGKLPTVLPAGTYRFAAPPSEPELATLAWLIGAYRFERYRRRPAKPCRLVPPAGVDAAEASRIAEAT